MALLLKTLLLLTGIVLVSGGAVQYSLNVYVDPDNGTNTTSCWTSNSPAQPCRNLSYALQYRSNSTRYILQQTTHYLDNTASNQPFRELNAVAISGNGSNVSVVCLEDSGLAFVSVENLRVANITFSNCSTVQNSTSANFSAPNGDFELSLTRAAVYISHCSNISFHNVNVTNSPGATGVIMYNTIGDNTFSGCTFSNNNNSTPLVYPGGGGVYVEFSYCLPGNTSCKNGTEESYTDHNKHSVYQFLDCKFWDNQAASFFPFITPYRQNHLAFSRGGGLSIFFNANSTNNTINVTGCTFIGNEAQWGAGMFAQFRDTSGGNRIFFNQSHFIQNNCSGRAGGGMKVGHYVYKEVTSQVRNSLEIHYSTFSENNASNGGGLSVSATRQLAPSSQLFSLLVHETEFILNRGKYGAALKVDLYYSLIQDGLKPNITLIDCRFKSNTVHSYVYTKPEEIGIGVVYANQVNVQFRGILLFKENAGTALAVVAVVDVSNCSAAFEYNTGTTGGAIALLGPSVIVINESSVLQFHFNVASKGGAIYNRYTRYTDQTPHSDCFFAHKNPFLHPDEWGAEVLFNSNTDSTGSNAIYSTSILPCAKAGGLEPENITKVFCWNNWTYTGGGDTCKDYISTGPGLVDVTRNLTFIYAYPGEVVQLPIYGQDEFGRNMSIVYLATAANNYKNQTNQTCRNILNSVCSNSSDYLYPYSYTLATNYTYVSQNIIEAYKVNYSNSIYDDYCNPPAYLNGTLPIYLDSIGDRSWHIELTLIFHDCPPGLLPTNISCHVGNYSACTSCQCKPRNNYREFVRCNSLSNASLANGYWMGPLCDNCSSLVVANCPPGYCRTGDEEFLALPSKDLDKHICGPQNRRGRVCGECIRNYGPALNSDTYKCVLCNISGETSILMKHITYYILSVYLPLCVLTVVIIMFSIELTTGPANAFILYSQVISSTFDIYADERIPLDAFTNHPHAFEDIYRFPYGIFNLEFFERFVPPEDLCFGTHLNTLDVMLLDYIVAFFPLTMMLVVVVTYNLKDLCCKRCASRFARVSHRIGDAVIPAFATFIVLSYTKFSLTSTYVCTILNFYEARGNTAAKNKYQYSYYAGQFSANDTDFILYYYLPAIFVFLTFVTIPPLVLLDYPLRLFEKVLYKVPCLWKRYPKSKMHILLDAFQGCYKNKWRCFAGLYFIFRLLINVTYRFTPTFLLQFLLQGIYCIVYALLVAYLKPYKEQYHIFNYIDSLIFLNLAIINQISLYIYAYVRSGYTAGLKLLLLTQYVLVFLPLVYMIGYLIWSLILVPRFRARVKEWLAKRQDHQLQSLLTREQSDVDDVDWERAGEINRYRRVPPELLVAGFTQEREEAANDSELPSKKSSNSGSVKHYGSTRESAKFEITTKY